MTKHKISFQCFKCGNQSFTKEFSFEIEFRCVNFSDDLVFTENKIEQYVCKSCGSSYKESDIIYNVEEIIRSYKDDKWEITDGSTCLCN